MTDSPQWPYQDNQGMRVQGNVHGDVHSQGPGQQWPPQGYQQPPPGRPPVQARPAARKPPRKRGPARAIIGWGIAAVVVFIVVSALASHGSTPQSPAASGAPAATSAAAPAAASTVTYVVTGSSSAQVTYGPAGTQLSATGPMRKTAAIPASPPGYYSIDAQLNGSGTVSCEILVGGTVISKATASGSYNIASCEIVQDPLSGQWQDANGA